MTNQFTELETITDEELLAASGGGAGKLIAGGLNTAIQYGRKNPDKVVNGLTTAYKTLFGSKDDTQQNLEVV